MKAAGKLNEKVFSFCVQSDCAQKVFARSAIEPFEAVLHDHARLPDRFKSTRYPQMRAQIAARRAQP